MDFFSQFFYLIQQSEITWWETFWLLFIVPLIYAYLVIALLVLFRKPFHKNAITDQLGITPKRFLKEFTLGCVCFAIDALVTHIFIVSKMVKFNFYASTSQVIISFIIVISYYELGFFTLHRTLHLKWFYWIHRPHHAGAKSPHPMTAHSFSAIERLAFIGMGLTGLSLISRIYPIAPLGIFIYTLVAHFQNAAGHMNVEAYPAWFPDKWWTKYITTSTFHGMHHIHPDSHFSCFFTFFDHIFKTCRWEEYRERYRVAKLGNFKKLKNHG